MTTKIPHNYSVHIVYPFNKKTKELFLREKTHCYYHVVRNGRDFGRPMFNKRFREYLIKFGFSFTQEIKTELASVSSICGVHIEVTKLKTGKQIKELLIRIPASGAKDAVNKGDRVVDFVKEQIGEDGKAEHSHKVAC